MLKVDSKICVFSAICEIISPSFSLPNLSAISALSARIFPSFSLPFRLFRVFRCSNKSHPRYYRISFSLPNPSNTCDTWKKKQALACPMFQRFQRFLREIKVRASPESFSFPQFLRFQCFLREFSQALACPIRFFRVFRC